MSLTREQFQQLETHWGMVVYAVCPGITEITDGGGSTIAEKLSTWRNKQFAKPSEEAIEGALLNTVLPALANDAQQEQAQKNGIDDVLARLSNSPLADKTPAEIYSIMQGQIDGWGSLAAAKADLRVWLPLIIAVIFWLVRRK